MYTETSHRLTINYINELKTITCNKLGSVLQQTAFTLIKNNHIDLVSMLY